MRNYDVYINGELTATIYKLDEEVEIILYCCNKQCDDIAFTIINNSKMIDTLYELLRIMKKWQREKQW